MALNARRAISAAMGKRSSSAPLVVSITRTTDRDAGDAPSSAATASKPPSSLNDTALGARE